jgi:hypothetical protein
MTGRSTSWSPVPARRGSPLRCRPMITGRKCGSRSAASSRSALIVHPRTLEVLRPLGVTDALLAGGDIAQTVHLHLGRSEVPVRLGRFALPDTAFPHGPGGTGPPHPELARRRGHRRSS